MTAHEYGRFLQDNLDASTPTRAALVEKIEQIFSSNKSNTLVNATPWLRCSIQVLARMDRPATIESGLFLFHRNGGTPPLTQNKHTSNAPGSKYT